jgi:energy-coupling factor transporter ATP-binding protein EcfA2
MQQRVAIARALAIEPDILLMDEAFNHLDAITARIMRFDLADILAMAKPTILFVTHDLSEAVFLSDRIYMMKSNPARIFKEVVIDFPRPRKPEDPRLPGIEAGPGVFQRAGGSGIMTRGARTAASRAGSVVVLLLLWGIAAKLMQDPEVLPGPAAIVVQRMTQA